MPKIPIIAEQSKPPVPKNKDLSSTRPRFTPPGGAPPLSVHSSYNRQGSDGTNIKAVKGK